MSRKRSIYKITKSNIILIGFIIIALLLIFYQFYVVNNNSLSTQIAAKATAYDAVTTIGVFIRQEKALGAVSGVVVQTVGDGGKVGKNEEVAKVFSNASAAQNYTKILQIQEKLDYYNNLQSQTLGEAADIESMDKSILATVGKMAQTGNGNNLEATADLDMELNDELTRRQLLTGITIDFAPVITDLQNQISALESAGAAASNAITTDESGNFAMTADGYESYFDYTKAEEFTVDEVKTFLNETKEKKETESMGKIITNFNWYIACVVDSGAVSSIKVGSPVTVCVKANESTVLEATVFAKNMDSAQNGECALILQCDAMNQDVSSLRNEEIEIRLHTYNGLRVDSRAIRTEDGEKGIYALISDKVVFRKIDVLYSGDGYVIAALDNSDSDNIQLYDAIIIEGRDLYDGKFIH